MPGALFLDRDGVVNEDCDYCHRVDQFAWMPGVFQTVRVANQLGLQVFVVTNQAGIARGYYTESDFHDLTRWMVGRFADEGAIINDVYFSPFHPDGQPPYNIESSMRKPGPGMLLQAAREHAIALQDSMLIGDQESDIMAGRAAGLRRCALLSAMPVTVPTLADDVLHSHADAVGWLQQWARRS